MTIMKGNNSRGPSSGKSGSGGDKGKSSGKGPLPRDFGNKAQRTPEAYEPPQTAKGAIERKWK
jgi:hypothetical protein